MAEIIEKDNNLVRSPGRRLLKLFALGIGIGLLFWVAYSSTNSVLITPLACGGQFFNADVCINAPMIAGNVGVIFVGILTVALLIRLKEIRPLIIALASSFVLWPIGGWISGLFWYESLFICVLAFLFTYTLFWLISNLKSFAFVVILSILVVVAVKLVPLLY